MTEREENSLHLDAMLVRHRLGNYPTTQAEAIAHHYLSLAMTSRDLHELVQMQRNSPNPVDWQDAIDRIVIMFKETHLRDLGLSLEWKKTLPL